MQKAKSSFVGEPRQRKLSVMSSHTAGLSRDGLRKRDSSQEGSSRNFAVTKRGGSHIDNDEFSANPQKKDKEQKYNPAYLPIKERKLDQLVNKMKPKMRFDRQMNLLHRHPNALEEITKGIRAD